MGSTSRITTPYERMHFRSLSKEKANKPWRKMVGVGFDLETTGLNTDRARIIQMSAVLSKKANNLDGFVEIDRINLFVNPDEHIGEEVSKHTGITNEMVMLQPKLEEPDAAGKTPLDRFMEFLERADFGFGHNIIRYDMPVLKSEMKRTGQRFELNLPLFDTYVWAQASRNYRRGGNSLKEVAKRYGVGIAADVSVGKASAHNAVTDVLMNTGVLWKMSEEVIDQHTLKRALRKQLHHVMMIEGG